MIKKKVPFVLLMVAAVIFSGCAGFITGSSGNVADVKFQKTREQLKNKPRRVLFNDDGNEIVYSIDKPTKQNFWDCQLTNVLNTQVDTVIYCDWSSGFGYFTHNTKVGSVFNTTEGIFAKNKTQAYIDHGTDSLAMAVEFCRKNNLEIFWSMRMNDTHDRAYPLLFSPIKKEHPEWLMGTKENPPVNGSWTAVDYTHPEIRDLAVKYAEEVCRDYDVDGIMLDFFRHPLFFKANAEGGSCSYVEREMMTNMMIRIHDMVTAEGKKRGKPILVAVRTPDDIEFSRRIGLDIEKWMEDGLIDLWIPTGYWRNNAIEYSINLGHHYNIPVYPSLDDSRVDDAMARSLRNSEDSYNARAMNWLYRGADGIQTFNYVSVPGPSRLDYIGDTASLAGKDKLYTTSARGYYHAIRDYMKHGMDAYLGYNFIVPGEKDLSIKKGKPTGVGILIGDDCSVSSPTVTLSLRSDAGIGKVSDLGVTVNGNNVVSTGVKKNRLYLDTAKGYTIEWRVKWLDGDKEGPANSAMVYACPQKNTWWLLQIYKIDGKIVAGFRGDSKYTVLDEDAAKGDFHTLRVTVTEQGTRLYVDNNPEASLFQGLLKQIVLPLRFGDVENNNDAEYDTDYFYAYDGGAVAPGTDIKWTMKYDGDRSPRDAEAITYYDGTKGSFAANHIEHSSIVDGSLRINTLGSDDGTYFDISEPSWYAYDVPPHFIKQGMNTIGFDLEGTNKSIKLQDLTVAIKY